MKSVQIKINIVFVSVCARLVETKGSGDGDILIYEVGLKKDQCSNHILDPAILDSSPKEELSALC